MTMRKQALSCPFKKSTMERDCARLHFRLDRNRYRSHQRDQSSSNPHAQRRPQHLHVTCNGSGNQHFLKSELIRDSAFHVKLRLKITHTRTRVGFGHARNTCNRSCNVSLKTLKVGAQPSNFLTFGAECQFVCNVMSSPTRSGLV